MTKPIVSICCVTYQHLNYIKDTLDSLLMQKTDFDYEICIGEDESNDGTREICQEYAGNYPDIIRLFLRSRTDVIYINGKATGRYNFIETLKQCKGKYIALCEGDDYWTDPYKLQKQVDFLEHNVEYSMCFSGIHILDEKKKSFLTEKVPLNKEYTNNDLLMNRIAHTCSFLFRQNLLGENFIIDQKIFAGDIFIALYMGEKGKIYGMKDSMAVYRKHEQGITNIMLEKGVQHYIQLIKQFVLFKKRFRSLDDDKISIKIVDYCLIVSQYFFKSYNFRFLYYGILIFFYRPSLLYKAPIKIFKKVLKNEKF